MDYIVVDFEWNQTPYGKGTSNRKIPFEIIEIGAIKLDEHGYFVDSFSAVIRPKIYKRLHHITKNLTGISKDELNHGELFTHTIVDFMLWCGEEDEYRFCTWGNTDLIELQRNMKYYHLDDLLMGPIKYYNVQKLFRLFYYPDEATAALETAVNYFGIEKSDDFHRAIHDAEYTAAVFSRMDLDKIKNYYSVDYYQNPKAKDEEIEVVYDAYYKKITREFNIKEDVLAAKDIKSIHCFKCGAEVKVLLPWFCGRSRAYYCIAQCQEHGYICGKIRLKKTESDKVFAVKTLKFVDEEEANGIRLMQEEVKQKRLEKRHKNSQDTDEYDSVGHVEGDRIF